MPIEDRVAKLESALVRANRRACALTIALGVTLACILGGSGQSQGSPKEVRASAFIVEDADGRKRALLDCLAGTPTFSLLDESGSPRLLVSLNKNGPAIGFADTDGRVRLQVSSYERGPSIDLYDKGGTSRIFLTMNDAEGPSVNVADAEGAARCSLGSFLTDLPDGTKKVHPESTIMLFGADRKGLWKVP